MEIPLEMWLNGKFQEMSDIIDWDMDIPLERWLNGKCQETSDRIDWDMDIPRNIGEVF